ncbi:uncharacterized protein A4U43_C06F1570 [Asparagus officinalis]|uniref:Uncharacterized protein n=1 Tax=Asparagus officinalis TaxID=4686 RepID=A0A5P1EIW9_ASPOF|nr:uncharacterized protein LOC109845007 [Asparagus officinalis]ONK65846.1 uncharacterized protein A4U43_C06F1570 [Asparagus officinalis]
MAKSMRSKRKKRLRTLRREIAEPFYDKKEDAKLKAQEAALNAPKLPVRMPKPSSDSMELITNETSSNSMDVEMADGGNDQSKSLLKPVGGIGKKKLKMKLQLKKEKRRKRGKGKVRRKHNI